MPLTNKQQTLDSTLRNEVKGTCLRDNVVDGTVPAFRDQRCDGLASARARASDRLELLARSRAVIAQLAAANRAVRQDKAERCRERTATKRLLLTSSRPSRSRRWSTRSGCRTSRSWADRGTPCRGALHSGIGQRTAQEKATSQRSSSPNVCQK
jgi:hypothetical protein